jgi:uncharacterized membrane protein YdfJ with MMPL/SSD domain
MKTKPNITGRLGRFSAEHPWRAVVIWLAFVALAVLAGGAVHTTKLHDSDGQVGQSGRAAATIAKEFHPHAGENVLLSSNTKTFNDAEFRAATRDVVSAVSATGVVTNVRSPLDNPAQVTRNQHDAIVSFDVTGESKDAVKRVGPVLDAVTKVAHAHPTISIEEAGDASGQKGVEQAVGKDFQTAEKISIPLALLVLLITFGAVVAALLPLGLALTAIFGATGLMAFTSHISGVDDSASSVMLLIGLAVGVDYCLFYVKREREERRKGRSPQEALQIAAATSGRSVLISGGTVLVSVCGMFLTGSKTFIGMAEATVLVVLAAVIGSLTVLPAMLALLGDRVDRGRLPFVGRDRSSCRAHRDSRIWGFIVDRTLARPMAAVVLGTTVLLALALPVVRMHTATPGATDYSKSIPVVKSWDHVMNAFPGSGTPANVVVTAPDVTASNVHRAIDAMTGQALAAGLVRQPIDITYAPNHHAAVVAMPIAGNGDNATSTHAIHALRDQVIPATISKVDGIQANVSGMTASNVDFNNLMRTRAPIVFAFVLALAFLVLLLSFRSIVIPIKAIVLNMLSVLASYGLLVAVFQWGWGERLLGFQSTGAVTSWLPLFLFVVLFSLSMDYHVFIISRIREAYDRGATTEDAIRRGIKSTAGVVTAAAIVMVMSFSVFAVLRSVSMKELGVGLAAAVLLDATIVRGVLLPATMTLLGDRNWYLPRWLNWIPQISHGAENDEAPSAGLGSDQVPSARVSEPEELMTIS